MLDRFHTDVVFTHTERKANGLPTFDDARLHFPCDFFAICRHVKLEFRNNII